MLCIHSDVQPKLWHFELVKSNWCPMSSQCQISSCFSLDSVPLMSYSGGIVTKGVKLSKIPAWFIQPRQLKPYISFFWTLEIFFAQNNVCGFCPPPLALKLKKPSWFGYTCGYQWLQQVCFSNAGSRLTCNDTRISHWLQQTCIKGQNSARNATEEKQLLYLFAVYLNKLWAERIHPINSVFRYWLLSSTSQHPVNSYPVNPFCVDTKLHAAKVYSTSNNKKLYIYGGAHCWQNANTLSASQSNKIHMTS